VAERPRDERGATTVLIIGFAVVLLMLAAVVVDASAAYLQRQGLDNLADGAALAGADAGASGQEVYTQGVDEDRLRLFADTARAGVADYLTRSGAYADHPGLRVDVSVDSAARSVTVRLRAPLDLPLHVPGSPERAVIGAAGSAIVSPER
jgi:uncharacterized membrane protein